MYYTYIVQHKDLASCTFPSDMSTPLAKILDLSLIPLKISFINAESNQVLLKTLIPLAVYQSEKYLANSSLKVYLMSARNMLGTHYLDIYQPSSKITLEA